jgi:hypothetical protein
MAAVPRANTSNLTTRPTASWLQKALAIQTVVPASRHAAQMAYVDPRKAVAALPLALPAVASATTVLLAA